MRYDVASALAEKSRFEGGRNVQSLKYAPELSKTLKVDTEKAAYDQASQTVTAPLSKKGFTEDYDSDEFGTFIEEHEKAETEEMARLDSIAGLAEDLNILPDEEAKYEEEATLNPEVAAQIAMAVINNPENMVATIKEGFNKSSGYTA